MPSMPRRLCASSVDVLRRTHDQRGIRLDIGHRAVRAERRVRLIGPGISASRWARPRLSPVTMSPRSSMTLSSVLNGAHVIVQTVVAGQDGRRAPATSTFNSRRRANRIPLALRDYADEVARVNYPDTRNCRDRSFVDARDILPHPRRTRLAARADHAAVQHPGTRTCCM